MLKLVEWSPELDLSSFYEEANRRGFENNSSQKRMIDTFKKEKEWKAWILYNNAKPIGSTISHSFDIMGSNSYRVLARTCTFGEFGNKSLIKPKRLIAEHQNLTDQFLLPACLNWARGNVYATSNESKIASQRLVHRYYFPTLQEIGIVENMGEIYYRKTKQTVWKIYADRFFENLRKHPRWNNDIS